MGKTKDAVLLLREGRPPHRIARAMGLSVHSVMAHLYKAVSEKTICRSDIALSYPKDLRDAVDKVVAEDSSPIPFGIFRVLGQDDREDSRESLLIYLRMRDARVALGDMYEFLRDIEMTLHGAIRQALQLEFGENEWWKKGIPEDVRIECVTREQQDNNPAENSYCYTSFISLRKIIDKRWGCFTKHLDGLESADKKDYLNGLLELNGIRNKVMHPIRGVNPTEDDFIVVREFARRLSHQGWRRLARA